MNKALEKMEAEQLDTVFGLEMNRALGPKLAAPTPEQLERIGASLDEAFRKLEEEKRAVVTKVGKNIASNER